MAPPAEHWAPVHAFIASRTGMALSAPQRRRLDERLAAMAGGRTAQQFVQHLKSPAGAAELEQLVSAVVVHKTDLFRDEVQLAAFRAEVLAPRVERSKRPLRIWSAGCATGEEVATLLLLLAQEGADPASTVLGTDISESALARARELSFSPDALRRVPAELRERYFVHRDGRAELVSALKVQASFQPHNLMDTPYPAPEQGGGFDVIFCRNVLIYFTAEAFQRTVVALAGRLVPGGTLVLSATEPLLQVPPTLRIQRGEQAFFYVRVDDPEAPGPGPLGAPPVRASPERGRDTGRFPSVGAPASSSRPSSGGLPAVSPGSGGTRRDSVRVPALPPAGPAGTRDSGRVVAVAPAGSSQAHADGLFACVLDGASTGLADATAEQDLRRCLALDPDHAAARYLLGLLLEQCGRPAEALAEYRRALDALESGRARSVPFFLNPARLRVACAHAVERLDAPGRR